MSWGSGGAKMGCAGFELGGGDGGRDGEGGRDGINKIERVLCILTGNYISILREIAMQLLFPPEPQEQHGGFSS